MTSSYINHIKRLRSDSKNGRLALEITVILIVKVILLWAIWTLFFSHPVAKDSRQAAVTKIILNKTQ
ncbi:MAG: hypothetical protein Q7T88_05095 [Methylotenera sp.]|nr:hypothetical protein [Methylotenera sp.]